MGWKFGENIDNYLSLFLPVFNYASLFVLHGVFFSFLLKRDRILQIYMYIPYWELFMRCFSITGAYSLKVQYFHVLETKMMRERERVYHIYVSAPLSYQLLKGICDSGGGSVYFQLLQDFIKSPPHFWTSTDNVMKGMIF